MENILFFFANLPVYSYGAMLGLGLLIGSYLAQREGRRKGFEPDFVFRCIVQVALVFIAAGRISCVFRLHGWRMLLYPGSCSAACSWMSALAYSQLACTPFTSCLGMWPTRQPSWMPLPLRQLMQSLAYLGSSVLGRETSSPLGVHLGEFSLHPFLCTELCSITSSSLTSGAFGAGCASTASSSWAIWLWGPGPAHPHALPGNNWRVGPALAVHPGFRGFRPGLALPVPAGPLTEARRRRYGSSWQTSLLYWAWILGVGLLMVKFFYWRFG